MITAYDIPCEHVNAKSLRPGDRFLHVIVGADRRAYHQIAMVISVTPTPDPPSRAEWRDLTCLSDGEFIQITGGAMMVRRLLSS